MDEYEALRISQQRSRKHLKYILNKAKSLPYTFIEIENRSH